jgi:bacterial/archaeal transporter family-2 protein
VSKELAVLVTVAAGGAVAMQAPANNLLSKYVGSLGAALVSFVIGLVCLVAVAFLFGGGVSTEGEAPPWYYWVFGGVGGAVIVTVSLIAVRELGAGGVTAATIAGQLTLSVVIDRMGVLGLDERPITWEKLFGVGLLALGTVLIVRE